MFQVSVKIITRTNKALHQVVTIAPMSAEAKTRRTAA
jgi:hypothetical protein